MTKSPFILLLRYILHDGNDPATMETPKRRIKVTSSSNEIFSVYQLVKSTLDFWGRILGWNQDKSLKSFLQCYSQSPLQLAWDFCIFKLTQPLTVSVKEKGGKPERKPYSLPYGLRNPYRNLKSEARTLTWLYVHEFGSWADFKRRHGRFFLHLGYFLHDSHDLIHPIYTGL